MIMSFIIHQLGLEAVSSFAVTSPRWSLSVQSDCRIEILPMAFSDPPAFRGILSISAPNEGITIAVSTGNRHSAAMHVAWIQLGNLRAEDGERSVGLIRLVFHTRKERLFDKQQDRGV